MENFDYENTFFESIIGSCLTGLQLHCMHCKYVFLFLVPGIVRRFNGQEIINTKEGTFPFKKPSCPKCKSINLQIIEKI